jgi:hypothetical protein
LATGYEHECATLTTREDDDDHTPRRVRWQILAIAMGVLAVVGALWWLSSSGRPLAAPDTDARPQLPEAVVGEVQAAATAGSPPVEERAATATAGPVVVAPQVASATPIEVDVLVEVRVEPEILAALRDCGHRRLSARLRTEASVGQGPVEATFEFARMAEATTVHLLQQHVRLRVADAESPIHVEWQAEAEKVRIVPMVAVGIAERVALKQRRATFDILPETVVRGRYRWPDGAPAAGQDLSFFGRHGAPAGIRVRTGGQGGFCFLVGARAAGTIETDGLEQVHGAPFAPREVVAGDVVEIERAARLRFRVLGHDGQPVEKYLLETGVPRASVATEAAHPDGVGFELVAILERFPWLRIYFDKAVHTVLVSPEWFATPFAVHEVRLADALPTGKVVVEGGLPDTGRAGTRLVLTGEGALSGLQMASTASPAVEWSIEGVPTGSYRAHFVRSTQEIALPSIVVVAPERIALLQCPRF